MNIKTPWYASNIAIGLAALLALVITFFFTAKADAQTFEGEMLIEWEAPTQGCDVNGQNCVPLTGANALTAYNLWIVDCENPGDFNGPPTVVLTAEHTSTDYHPVVTHGQRLCVRIKAINSSGPSAFSNQAEKLFELLLPPNPPTNLRIRFTVTPTG